ncbi:MAG: methionyl-tRNA formyltransferase [Acidobacteria bacterium]|nr:methionyl-tRNA formyltransferase [Acidobacteriota bacterium]
MKIVFMGTPQAAVPSLERLLEDGHEIVAVYTQPDRPSGRGKKLRSSPVKLFAAEKDLPVFQPLNIRTAEAISEFRSSGADVTVVIAYGRILPQEFLNAFRYGAINVHFSLLPKYRGAAPVNWAIVNGDTVTGVTTMRMDAGLDTGDILLQDRSTIDERETSEHLLARLAELAPEVLSRTLTEIDSIVAIPQDDSEATLAPILKREDGEIDWKKTATVIANRVRGFQPFPSAFTFREGKRLTIWSAVEEKNRDIKASEPGKIMIAHGEDLLVSCGNGTLLRIEELQIEGRQRMAVRAFLNGVKLEAGEFLGQ